MASRADRFRPPPTVLGPIGRDIREAADEARSRPLLDLPGNARDAFLRDGGRLAFERHYFERRRSLVALGLASWLWRRADDLEALSGTIQAICGEDRWALPAHEEEIDLFACETAFALSEITTILSGDLSASAAGMAKAEVERRVLSPFMARPIWAWERMRNNWCAVCAASIGAATIYLVDDEPRRAAILSRLEPTLDSFLESFAGDGACLEGLGYWTYGVGFFAAYAELLGRSVAGARDWVADERFRRIAAFQSKAYLTDSISVAFSDASSRERFRPGLAAFLASLFPKALPPAPSLASRLADDECGRWCLSFRDILWRNEYEDAGSPRAAFPPKAGAPKPAAWFPKAQWLVCPASSPRSLGFAAKGGCNDEPHNHNDLGSFQLAAGDTQFIAELGAGEYTRDYFGENRYSILCTSSLGHSVPIVCGLAQKAGVDRRASVILCDHSRMIGGAAARLSMDIAAAYDLPSLRRLTRSFDFDGESRLILRDEFEFERGLSPAGTAEAGSAVIERFVTGLPASRISIEPGRAILEAPEGRLLVSSSAEASPRLTTLEHRAHDGVPMEVVCLDYEIPPHRGISAFAVEFVFLLIR